MKKSYEKKRPRLFLESWRDEVPDLQYTVTENKQIEHGDGDGVVGPCRSTSTQNLGMHI